MNLKWTGERLVTQIDSVYGTFEHLHRYALSLEICKDKKVLDIASGEGYGTNLLSKVSEYVWGVDVSEEAVSHAKKKYSGRNIEFIQGSATKIPLDNGQVDVIVSFETLEHLEEHDLFFSEMKRVLREDGVLIISTPNKAVYSQRDPDNPYHVRELMTEEFKNLVDKWFSYSEMFKQRMFVGSVVSSDSRDGGTFTFFDGSFDHIDKSFTEHEFFNKAFFNVMVASNCSSILGALPAVTLFSSYKSFLSEREVLVAELKKQRDDLERIRSSMFYKVYRSLAENRLNFIEKYFGRK